MDHFQSDVEPYHPWTLESIRDKYNAMLEQEKRANRRVAIVSWVYFILMFCLPFVIWVSLLLMPHFEWDTCKIFMLSILTALGWWAAIIIYYNNIRKRNK